MVPGWLDSNWLPSPSGWAGKVVPMGMLIIPVPSSASIGMKASRSTLTRDGGLGVVLGALPLCPMGTSAWLPVKCEVMPVARRTSAEPPVAAGLVETSVAGVLAAGAVCASTTIAPGVVVTVTTAGTVI